LCGGVAVMSAIIRLQSDVGEPLLHGRQVGNTNEGMIEFCG